MEYRKEPIIGFEMYQVDTEGVVYNRDGSVKKYSLNHGGYPCVTFSINGREIGSSVHTLVARQFIKNNDPEHLTQVNHIDGVKTNNKVDNLEWVSSSQNIRHAIDVLHRSIGQENLRAVYGYDKTTKEMVYFFSSIIGAARYFTELSDTKNPNHEKYVQHSIWRVCNNYRKSWHGYIWRYANGIDHKSTIQSTICAHDEIGEPQRT